MLSQIGVRVTHPALASTRSNKPVTRSHMRRPRPYHVAIRPARSIENRYQARNHRGRSAMPRPWPLACSPRPPPAGRGVRRSGRSAPARRPRSALGRETEASRKSSAPLPCIGKLRRARGLGVSPMCSLRAEHRMDDRSAWRCLPPHLTTSRRGDRSRDERRRSRATIGRLPIRRARLWASTRIERPKHIA